MSPAKAGLSASRLVWIRPEWLLVGALWVCYVLNYADRQVVYTLFPALQKDFAFTDPVLGLTGGLFLWVYGLTSPLAGWVGDRWSQTRLVCGSLIAWSFFTLISGLAPNGAVLLASRALLGVSEAFFMPAAYALMANAHGPATRSKAIGIFATSQMFGVAIGGSLSGYIAEHFHWRFSFLVLAAVGLLYAAPLAWFFSRLPAGMRVKPQSNESRSGGWSELVRIPSLLIVTGFVTTLNFGLYLVYTWLPTFLYDKFHLGLARSSFEASLYPQIGTFAGLLLGSAAADHLYRRRSPDGRFRVVWIAFVLAAPCMLWIGKSTTLDGTRISGILFGFFAGCIIANQAASAFDVVPVALRASTIGILNFLSACVSGFAPFGGGLARRTIGVNQLMAFTALAYLVTGLIVLWGLRRYFASDYRRAQASLNQPV